MQIFLRPKLSAGLIAVLMACASGARSADVPVAGDSIQSIEVNGVKRVYRQHIPTGYDGTRYLPLVLVLHGRGGNGLVVEANTSFGQKADKEHFIAVFPNALGRPQTWNAGLNPEQTEKGEDVEFIRQLLDKLQSTLKIDRHRIYCCGFSSGAIMSGRLGAELSDRFAAIGIASGAIGAKQTDGSERVIPTPKNPVSVIVFHGEKDGTIHYNGGGSLMNWLSVARAIEFWLKEAGCAPPPETKTEQNGGLTIDRYKSPGGAEVVLYSFANGGHVWPSRFNADELSATDVMWDFFAQHPKP